MDFNRSRAGTGFVPSALLFHILVWPAHTNRLTVSFVTVDIGGDSSDEWDRLRAVSDPPDGVSYVFLSCAVRGDVGREALEKGLVTGHAYSILKMRQVSARAHARPRELRALCASCNNKALCGRSVSLLNTNCQTSCGKKFVGSRWVLLTNATCCQTSCGKKLVQIRNPWGQHEWTGRFSDKSSDWVILFCGLVSTDFVEADGREDEVGGERIR